jgi:hypothetical protein
MVGAGTWAKQIPENRNSINVAQQRRIFMLSPPPNCSLIRSKVIL